MASQLRIAHDAVSAVDGSRAPEIDDWRGPAAAAAREALDDLDRSLHGLRTAASDWLSAVRRAAADG